MNLTDKQNEKAKFIAYFFRWLKLFCFFLSKTITLIYVGVNVVYILNSWIIIVPFFITIIYLFAEYMKEDIRGYVDDKFRKTISNNTP